MLERQFTALYSPMTPQVTQNTSGRSSAIDWRTDPARAMSSAGPFASDLLSATYRCRTYDTAVMELSCR